MKDNPYVTGDDDDNHTHYVPIDDGEVSVVDNELQVEEELPEHKNIDEARYDQVY